MTLKIKFLSIPGYEKVIEATDVSAKLHCIIAIHNTIMGPSLGGTRIYPYPTFESALNDALRLAKGMTYKSAIAETGFGGGKAVIIADHHQKTKEMLLAYAEVVNTLEGKYICAEDSGTTLEDMTLIHSKTPYVAAFSSNKSSGDPSPFTAWGIVQGIEACAMKLWGNREVRGRTIAVQGLGNVGAKLADHLFWLGADLIISDIDENITANFAHNYGAEIVSPDEIYSVPCDIFSPCALGGIINDKTIPQFNCLAIAGAANNQLLEPKHGLQLMERGILYAPDYIINAGGIINASSEYDSSGYNSKTSRDKIHRIFDHLIQIFDKSLNEKKPTSTIADELAEFKLKHGIGKRKHPLLFPLCQCS